MIMRRAETLRTTALFVLGSTALAVTQWTTWTDGAWPAIARAIVGPWLGVWLAAAGMVSALALFNALLLSYSRVPLVMARDGFLPRRLAATDERGTPRAAVVASAVAYSGFALLSFGGLLAADVLLYTAALAMEFAALIELRRAEPDLVGSFRVPLGRAGLSFLAAPPVLLLVTGVVLEVRSPEIGLPGVLVAAALALLGPILYAATGRARSLDASRDAR